MTGEREIIQEFVRRHYRTAKTPELRIEPLRGGLVCDGIAKVTVALSEPASFVVKPLCGPSLREERLHRSIDEAMQGGLAPRILDWTSVDSNSGLLFLEWLEGFDPWPWRFDGCAALTLQQLARLHTTAAAELPDVAEDWDYDSELQQSARETTVFYEQTWRSGSRPAHRAMMQSLRRLTEALPELRHQLEQRTGSTLLHGDVHPGNAVVTGGNGHSRAVLLDWARARHGSPLEDVSSWLQSLAFWEPAVRQSHDTLFRGYLNATETDWKLDDDTRQGYWLAGACNGLAGALRYHMAVMTDDGRSETEREQSRRAAADWLRILHRADVVWRRG